ncbi:hypothetical protein ACJJIX_01990 [Microbulbifer sp. VAAC004]|uniref:hypothetical protein n=1 Tax=unclassified Microbulbifer TaxID=2619833 RepID=UPI0040399226
MAPLAKQLYQHQLGMGDAKRTMAEYKRLFRERLDTIHSADLKSLAPFKIKGIDALFLGHNFVPKGVTVGNCHFMDSYRGEPGEEMTLVCLNELQH